MNASVDSSSPEAALSYAHIRPTSNTLIEEGLIEPMIVAFSSAQGADFGNRDMWFNSVRNGNYADLVINDLTEFMETNYNVSNVRRAIGASPWAAKARFVLG